MVIDYPNIRRSESCPFCRGAKARGLIACWPCFRSEGLRNGENAAQAYTLETTEQRLIEAEDYNRDLRLRIRDGQVGSGMKHR